MTAKRLQDLSYYCAFAYRPQVAAQLVWCLYKLSVTLELAFSVGAPKPAFRKDRSCK